MTYWMVSPEIGVAMPADGFQAMLSVFPLSRNDVPRS